MDVHGSEVEVQIRMLNMGNAIAKFVRWHDHLVGDYLNKDVTAQSACMVLIKPIFSAIKFVDELLDVLLLLDSILDNFFCSLVFHFSDVS
jgi:hypothetical protein